MNCPYDFDILCACALGELGAREADEVRRHTASCPRCAGAAREFEALSGALRDLPRVEPGGGVWAGVQEAVEVPRREPGARPAWIGALVRPYALAGAAAVLVLGLAVFRLAGGGPKAPVTQGLAVREMGGTFARQPAADAALAWYLRDARALVADALQCAEAGDEACWRGVKVRLEARGLRSRGQQYAAPGPTGLTPGQRALVRDSMRLVRVIRDWPPSRLAAEGPALGREIARANLPSRLKEGMAP